MHSLNAGQVVKIDIFPVWVSTGIIPVHHDKTPQDFLLMQWELTANILLISDKIQEYLGKYRYQVEFGNIIECACPCLCVSPYIYIVYVTYNYSAFFSQTSTS